MELSNKTKMKFLLKVKKIKTFKSGVKMEKQTRRKRTMISMMKMKIQFNNSQKKLQKLMKKSNKQKTPSGIKNHLKVRAAS